MPLSIDYEAPPDAYPEIEQPTPHAEAYMAHPLARGGYTSTAKALQVASMSFGMKIGGFRNRELKRNAFKKICLAKGMAMRICTAMQFAISNIVIFPQKTK